MNGSDKYIGHQELSRERIHGSWSAGHRKEDVGLCKDKEIAFPE